MAQRLQARSRARSGNRTSSRYRHPGEARADQDANRGAAVGQVDLLVTNDRSWPAKLASVVPNVAILLLAEFA